uniref:(California timema) hypothetical protein n=1 Tax=Timema californicum TaxID=61474 RepID=A0A7R9JI14_TIMCA|nr:unnamed protein product [Timema californicum]
MLSEADETSLEGLSELLTAIGRDLEYMLDLEPYFDTIKKFCFNSNKFSNKVRLMMVKLVNLRIRMWDPNRATVNKIIFKADKEMSDELPAQNLTTEIAREKIIAKDTAYSDTNVKEKVLEIELSQTKLNDQFSSSTSSFSCTPSSSGDEISLNTESRGKDPQMLKYTPITVKEPTNQSNKESILCTKVAKKTLLVYSSEDEIPLKSKLNKDKHSKSSETMVKGDTLNPPVSDYKPRRDQISDKSGFVDKSLQEKTGGTLESLLKDYLDLSDKSSTKGNTIGLNNALVTGESPNGKFDNLNESGCSSVFLERKLTEEKKWLQTTRKKMVDLKDMRSQEYDTYLYMNQSLSSEVTLHHGLATNFLNEACNIHEEDIFHGFDLHLEEVIRFQGQVDATVHRLMLFREHWSLYLLCVSRLERWINKAQEIQVSGKHKD